MKNEKHIIVCGDYLPGSTGVTCKCCDSKVYYKSGKYDNIMNKEFMCSNCFVSLTAITNKKLNVDVSDVPEALCRMGAS